MHGSDVHLENWKMYTNIVEKYAGHGYTVIYIAIIVGVPFIQSFVKDNIWLQAHSLSHAAASFSETWESFHFETGVVWSQKTLFTFSQSASLQSAFPVSMALFIGQSGWK